MRPMFAPKFAAQEFILEVDRHVVLAAEVGGIELARHVRGARPDVRAEAGGAAEVPLPDGRQRRRVDLAGVEAWAVVEPRLDVRAEAVVRDLGREGAGPEVIERDAIARAECHRLQPLSH